MKKFSYLIILLSIFISSCQIKNNVLPLKVLTPMQAPALAFYKSLSDDDLTTSNNPKNILGSMATDDYDVIVIDIISGLDMINKGAKYALSAVITFGNYFVLNLNNDDNNIMENSDVIISFGKGLTSDLIFKSIYPEITPTHYVNSVSDVAAVATSGVIALEQGQTKVDYVFIAQPVMETVLTKNTKASVYASIKDEFSQKYQTSGIPQAGVFIANKTYQKSREEVNYFLATLKTNINLLLEDASILDKVNSDAFSSKVGITIDIAKKVIANNNQLGLGFAYAKDYLVDLNKYYQVLQLEPFNSNYILDYKG